MSQDENPDAAVTATSSAIVTMPATWTNLWGSWPLTRYQHAAAYDSDRKVLVTYGGQASASGPYYDDIWEWNGDKGTWTQKTALGSNAFTRSGHSMVYDPVSKKTFMFGGWQPAAAFYIAGQWEWDGPTTTWTKRETVGGNEPDPRRDHAMAYDSDRQRIVMFGGYGGPGTEETGKVRLNDLWEWNVNTHGWSQPTVTGTKPAPRYGHTMVYDSARKKIIVRGGTIASTSAVNETWEWDASTGAWTQLVTTGTAPTYGTYLGYNPIAYDSARMKTILYAYGYGNGTSALLYELDPLTPTWNLIANTRDPLDPTGYPPHLYGTLNYDAGRMRTIVFGGQGGSVRELWEYNGADASWKNRSIPVNGPIQRTYPSLAYDSMRGKLMLFGGYRNGDTNPYKQDIWEWSGSDATWISRTTPDIKPPPRHQSALAYDSKRDRLLLYSGAGNGTLTDLWQWTPSTQAWSEIVPSGTRPPAMARHGLFYDKARDRVLAVGANNNPIWEYDPNANSWTNRSTSAPTGVSFTYTATTLDTDRDKLVSVGTYTSANNLYTSDVWEWDANDGAPTWQARPIAPGTTAPLPRISVYPIVYDSARRVVILIGGHAYVPANSVNGPSNDSWEWNGSTGTWTETTPTGVKPLPRETHLMAFDERRGTTYLFGGAVSADTTYGPQEIWEYAPNAAPRPNGASCSAATAARCQSGNCVDGVCCAVSSCSGTCRACNVPGMEGMCADVQPGQSDDGCAADQACDANHQCKSRNGQACGAFSDCGSGFCIDGVCCDTACTGTCKTCNVTGRRGICSNVPAGDEDPIGAPACVSTGDEGHFCDGNGVCNNAKKAVGKPCTASGQCSTNYCIDGYCCNSTCNGTCLSCAKPGALGACSAVTVGQQDPSATMPCDQPNQYCNGSSGTGSCLSNKKPNGGACTAATDCGSNFCVDGYCCNGACTGSCQACNVAGSLGSCVNVIAGSPDPNSGCALPQACDATATCQSGKRANGAVCAAAADCLSNFCVDGVCCEGGCTGTCRTCANPDGKCVPVSPGGADPTATPACSSPNYCAAGGECTSGRKPNGAACALNNECGSNLCIDGTCCETSCYGSCQTCKNSTGTCMNTPDGMDPRQNCKGDGVCAGTCNGQGACRYPAQGLKCRDAGCQSDGYIGGAGSCDGAGRCMFTTTTDCQGFICDMATGRCLTDCASDPMCVSRSYCNQSQCPVTLPNGEQCDRDRQCQSAHCARANPSDAKGVCCDRACDACGSCNMPGSVGTCVPAPAGSDDVRCINSASDPSGKCGGKCDGQWACQFPAALTPCGTCKGCDGSGKCNQALEDDATCGDIDCDGLDTACMDYNDIRANRCNKTLMACKAPNATATCTSVNMTCGPDGSTPGDSGAPTDGAAGDDAGKGGGGGGGGCCAVAGASSDRPGGVLTLTSLAVVAWVRRRRTHRRARG